MTHMKAAHSVSFAGSQLPLLARMNALPSHTIFDTCQFCDGLPSNLSERHPDQSTTEALDALQRHVGHHLRSLALISLSWFNEAGSSVPSRTAASDDLLDDKEPLIFPDPSTYDRPMSASHIDDDPAGNLPLLPGIPDDPAWAMWLDKVMEDSQNKSTLISPYFQLDQSGRSDPDALAQREALGSSLSLSRAGIAVGLREREWSLRKVDGSFIRLEIGDTPDDALSKFRARYEELGFAEQDRLHLIPEMRAPRIRFKTSDFIAALIALKKDAWAVYESCRDFSTEGSLEDISSSVLHLHAVLIGVEQSLIDQSLSEPKLDDLMSILNDSGDTLLVLISLLQKHNRRLGSIDVILRRLAPFPSRLASNSDSLLTFIRYMILIRKIPAFHLLTNASEGELPVVRDEGYFDNACEQLCQHVQNWVLRFSKFSDIRACRLTTEINNDKIIDRLDNAVLDGSDVDEYLSDRVKRRDVFMSITMTMIWEFVFARYLFGMDREQRQKLKSLEKTLLEVGPPAAVHQWRATTLTLLSKRDAFQQQREQDTVAVVQMIFQTLSEILPPPPHLEEHIQEQLIRVMKYAVDLSIKMRKQRAEYMMLPPLQPEYEANGDLARQVHFNAALMNERSGDTFSNEELEAQHAVVRIVLFPLVVKKDNDSGGDYEIVVCPAQVLVAKPERHARHITPDPMGENPNYSSVSI
jgi:hypothetical protein